MKCNNSLKKEKINNDDKAFFLVVITTMILFFFGLYINDIAISEVNNEIRRIHINSILTGKEVKNCSMEKAFKLDINFCDIKGSRELSYK